MKIIEGERVPIKSWCNNPEEKAIEQAKNLAKLPFIFKQICLMADAHCGFAMPIGGVIACINAIIPGAVGVDIGCGMIAVKTSITEITSEQIKRIFGGSKDYHGGIRSLIPLGFSHHDKKQEWEGFNEAPNLPIVNQQLDSTRKQLGSLGGGNHFIEIQKGNDGFIWLMVHSGSRNFGYRIAKEYCKIAQELCQRWHSNIPILKGEDSLAFLPIGSKEANDYLKAMNFALKFAQANRQRMMEKICYCVNKEIKCTFDQEINIHHNYANIENHFGKNVWVHRKGATSAKKGQLGIIPGSQGTSSYIVIGKGNPESFQSCSHGAGRAMSRTKARNTLNLEGEINKMDKKGIVHGLRNKKELDEASSSYKDIDIVMEEQKDLVDVYVKLEPLGVIKGG